MEPPKPFQSLEDYLTLSSIAVRLPRSERAVAVPAWPRRPVGDLLHDALVQTVEIGGCLEIHRLAKVVGWRVVSLGAPAFDRLVLRRIPDKTALERERRDPALDEAVLIAADECVPLGLGIRDHLNSHCRGS